MKKILISAMTFLQFGVALAGINPNYSGVYTIKVDLKAMSTFSSGTPYWYMRNNTSGNKLIIKKIFLMSEFVGTAASTLSQFAIFRFSGATPTGGSSINAVKLDSTMPSTNLLSAGFATAGLTMTGTTVDPDPLFLTTTINQLVTSVIASPFDSDEDDLEEIVLNNGEGLVIQAFNNLVGGIGLHGVIKYAERP